MPTTILHLTDLHFGWDGADPQRLAQRKLCLDGILPVLQNLPPEWKPNVVCLSGDIGWKGSKEDYELAQEWLNKLLNICGLGYDSVLVCAGNHDINRNRSSKYARPNSSTEADQILSIPIADHFLKAFEDYSDFCKRVGIIPVKHGEEESFLVGERMIANIRFVTLNSSWFCKDDEDEGKLWIGFPHIQFLESRNQLVDVHSGYNSEPITVVLVHHPFGSLHQEEQNAWNSRANPKDYLAKRCHIILTGHTHAEIRDADRIAQGAYHFTGGAAYAGAGHFNSFKLIKLEENTITYRSFEFNPRAANNSWQPYGNANLLHLSSPTVPATVSEKKKS